MTGNITNAIKETIDAASALILLCETFFNETPYSDNSFIIYEYMMQKIDTAMDNMLSLSLSIAGSSYVIEGANSYLDQILALTARMQVLAEKKALMSLPTTGKNH